MDAEKVYDAMLTHFRTQNHVHNWWACPISHTQPDKATKHKNIDSCQSYKLMIL